MENWQRKFITRHLPKLIDFTWCNTILLTFLQANGVLSGEEVHEIDGNPNRIKRAHKLYDIVVTRKDAYQLLLSACKETNQTGVVSILEDGEREHKLLPPVDRNVGQGSAETAGSLWVSKDNDGNNTLVYEMAILEDVSCDGFKFWATSKIENGHAHVFTVRGCLGRTRLHWAMCKHDLDLETIKLIIDSAKLDINQPDDEGDTMLHIALNNGRNFNTIKNLLALGADWRKKGSDNASVLTYAVVGSNKEAFLYFKSLGADVNAKQYSGKIPLHAVRWTISKDHLGMTKFLLENGAKLKAKDNDGKTLAQLMSSCRIVSVAEYNEWKEGMIKLGHASLFNGNQDRKDPFKIFHQLINRFGF